MHLSRWIAIAVICLAPLAAAGGAGEGTELRGLFCDSRHALARAIDLIAAGASDAEAAILSSDTRVACTHATLIVFVVSDIVLDLSGTPARRTYRASLVAVIVGTARRPLDPPVPVFFFRPHDLPILGGAQQL